MKIAVLSDIHGNLEALRAVLSHLHSRQIDEIYCLGDIVGYGPHPDECIDLVREHCRRAVMGNHDAALCGILSGDYFDPPGKKALRKSARMVRDENLSFLRNLPIVISAHGLTFAHASPHHPDAWPYLHSPEAAADAFRAFTTPVCFIGHTHVPVIVSEQLTESPFRQGEKMLINVGSVGQPRDGRPEAAVGILETDGWTYDLERIPYDISKTVEAIRKAHFPSILGDRLRLGI